MANRNTKEHEDIAVLLAATFAHPELPKVMWEHMADALCAMDESFDKYENPEVVREIIAGHRRQREARAARKGGRR